MVSLPSPISTIGDGLRRVTCSTGRYDNSPLKGCWQRTRSPGLIRPISTGPVRVQTFVFQGKQEDALTFCTINCRVAVTLPLLDHRLVFRLRLLAAIRVLGTGGVAAVLIGVGRLELVVATAIVRPPALAETEIGLQILAGDTTHRGGDPLVEIGDHGVEPLDLVLRGGRVARGVAQEFSATCGILSDTHPWFP